MVPGGTARGDPEWNQTWPPAPTSSFPGVQGCAGRGIPGANLCLRMSPATSSPVLQDCTGQENKSPGQQRGRGLAPSLCGLSCHLPALVLGPDCASSRPCSQPQSRSCPCPHTDLSPGCSQQGHPASPNPRLCCPAMGGRGGQLTVEAAYIQCHASLLLGGCPLKLSRREGAGSPRDHGLHESMLTHGLEATLPVIRHKPGG